MKKQNRKSWAMAYCGMAAALCVALMLLIVPELDENLPVELPGNVKIDGVISPLKTDRKSTRLNSSHRT